MMGRVVMVLVAVALTLLGTAGSAGAAPIRSVYDAVELSCRALTSAGGTAFLEVTTRPDGGAFTTLWRPGDDPEVDDPWLSGTTSEASLAGSTLTASIPLVDVASEADRGIAVVQAVVSPSGAASTSRMRGGDGNVQSRSTTTTTPAEATGSLTVPGVGTFELEGCDVWLHRVESFMTDPAAYVENLAAHVVIECTIDGVDSAVSLFVEGFMLGDRGEVEVGIQELPEGSEEPVLFGGGSATLTRTSLAATVDITDSSGSPLGTATVDADLAVLDRDRIRVGNGALTSTVRTETLGLDGQVTLPDGRSFSLDGCSGLREYGQQRVHPY